jgi:hypothetical protein
MVAQRFKLRNGLARRQLRQRSKTHGANERASSGSVSACCAGLHALRRRIIVGEEQQMSELIFLVEEASEGGYTARALGESIFTEAETLEQLHEQVRDAVRCHYEEDKLPAIIRLR